MTSNDNDHNSKIRPYFPHPRPHSSPSLLHAPSTTLASVDAKGFTTLLIPPCHAALALHPAKDVGHPLETAGGGLGGRRQAAENVCRRFYASRAGGMTVFGRGRASLAGARGARLSPRERTDVAHSLASAVKFHPSCALSPVFLAVPSLLPASHVSLGTQL
ncbi:hypothetical protein PSPO01_05220 [Paraphaeosphaeria sporulosa]